MLALAVGFAAAALVGLAMQVSIFRFMQGQDMRQTMVTIGLSIVIADLLLWVFSGQVHQLSPPDWLNGPLRGLPVINAYSKYRLALLPVGIAIGILLWLFLNRTQGRDDDPGGRRRPRDARRLRREREPRVRDHVRHRCGARRASAA